MARASQGHLAQNRLLAELPPATVGRLLPCLELITLRLRDVLYRPGEAIRYAYFPLDSALSLIAAMADGRSVEVSIYGYEGVLGVHSVLGAKSYWYYAVVQIPGSCLRLPIEVLQTEFKKGGVLHDRLLSYTHDLLNQTSQTAACNRIHLIEQRLARWLLMIHQRAKRDEFPLTQEFLSDMLGTPRSEVSMAAKSLREGGLIRYQRGRMKILDRTALESAACECYQLTAEITR